MTQTNKYNYILMNPRPQHFEQIQDLCRRVYPFSKPWSIAQLESHKSYFPDGQLIVVEEETGKVVGLAFSLIVVWNDYSPQDNWQDFTSGGFFHNHNPKKGKTLYGAEVMVDPEYRGKGIGKMLYKGRREIVDKYNLKRIRAGARLRGYSKFKDQYSPEDYVKQVVEKNIYDPTLSFQLGQDFKAIDVAPNYLFNDPESLGYAAVIEWLNPKTNSEADYEKQKQGIESFLSGEKFVLQYLPKELRHLVRKATQALGKAILDLEGEKFYGKVESYREQLKKTRTRKRNSDQLQSISKSLAKESKQDLLRLAHAFSLQLEVVNVCEAAYRTWRQRQKSPPLGIKNKLNLTYVLTAHPTEARSKMTVEILGQIQKLLVDGVHNNFFFSETTLSTQMRLLWLQSLVKIKKPSVVDEAEYIYSMVFASDIFDFILQEKPGYDLKLRTWVGGDKDGHPGVNKDVMKQCLNGSRQHLVDYVQQKFTLLLSDLTKLSQIGKAKNSEIDSIKSFSNNLKKLQNISNGDGTRLKTWVVKFNSFVKRSSLFVKDHEQIQLIHRALELFPALVLPIELREDSQLIHEALSDKKSAIRAMLEELSRISGAMSITNYARGLVISHCESDEHLTDACKLVDLVCKQSTLPVIPLFESREALIAGKKILKAWLKFKKNQDRVQRHWHNKFEIMLGYSDSSKQTGVLSSRLLIANSMQSIDKSLRPMQIKPIFFHGSGGSVARGGGSLKEQISWWSQSAIENPKMTIQGEMIQRLFVSKEILNSQSAHFTAEALRRKVHKLKREKNKELYKLSQLASDEYTSLVENPELLADLLSSTPYRYLEILKIGSRPSKRPTDKVSVSSLRAIPWILCWTQTRILWPTWWGLGTAWGKMSDEEKNSLKLLFKSDPFFASFVKMMSFTLAKVELDIWELYVQGENAEKLIRMFRQEYKRCQDFVTEVSEEKQAIWYRPWLEESIRLRSTHIHILNLIQIQAMKSSDEILLRESIVGIACGMLTTG